MGMEAIREVKRIDGLSRAFRPHVHDELSIAHVWSGSTLAWIAGEEVSISGECLVVIPAGVAHACNPRPGSGWSYTLALLDARACPGAEASAPYRILPSTDRLRASFRSLDQDSAPDLLEALGEVLIGSSRTERPPARSSSLRRVMDHLRAHRTEPLRLEELCAVAGLSKYHLVRAFREAYGLTPHAYLLNLRVNEAKARLKRGEDLASVALESGFCDQSHFSRVFARAVGLTPAAYQKIAAIPSKMSAREHS